MHAYFSFDHSRWRQIISGYQTSGSNSVTDSSRHSLLLTSLHFFLYLRRFNGRSAMAEVHYQQRRRKTGKTAKERGHPHTRPARQTSPGSRTPPHLRRDRSVQCDLMKNSKKNANGRQEHQNMSKPDGSQGSRDFVGATGIQ